MEKRNIIVGVAGHVDHGKTSLVKALTGIDTDRLPEEKRRNLSIEPGFAHLILPPFSFDFVDIPGHESYFPNALRSLWGVDIALLVVAANEGVMPQTREHFEVVKTLGAKEGFTVLTKCDLVDKETPFLAQEEIKELVKGSFLEGKPIIKFSFPKKEGREEIIKTLFEIGKKEKGKEKEKLFRFFVDRVFSHKGRGTVVTGLVTSGELSLKEKVEIYPERKTALVKNLQRQGREVEKIKGKERAGINLSCEKEILKRGSILGKPDELLPTYIINVNLKVFPLSPRPLYHQEKIYLYHLSQEAKGRVYLMGKKLLKPGESSPAQIRLTSPLVPFFEDPIIIRFLSPSVTCGGGIIIDTHPPKLRQGKLWFLAKTAQFSSQERPLLTPLTRSFEKSATQISQETGLKKEIVKEEAEKLISEGKIREIFPEVYISSEKIEEAGKILVKSLEELMERNLYLPPMTSQELFTRLSPPFSLPLFELLLSQLIKEGRLKKEEGRLKIPSRKMPQKFMRLEKEILRKVQSSPPIREAELISLKGFSSKEVYKVLEYLLKEGKIVKFKDAAYIEKEEFKKALKLVEEFLEKKGKITVKEAKSLLNWGRRATVSFLEYLDYLKITQRKEDYRILLRKKVSSQSF